MGITGVRLPGVGLCGGPGVSGEGEAILQGFTFEGVSLVDGFDPLIPDQLAGAV